MWVKTITVSGGFGLRLAREEQEEHGNGQGGLKDLTINLIKDLDGCQSLQVAESLQLEVKEETKSRKAI